MKKVNESLTAPTKKKSRSTLESAGHIAALAAKQVNRGVNIAGRGIHIAGSAAESINKFVLPIDEVGRIATGKGTKGDYASTALKLAPFIGNAVRGARIAKEAIEIEKLILATKARGSARVNAAINSKTTGDFYPDRVLPRTQSSRSQMMRESERFKESYNNRRRP